MDARRVVASIVVLAVAPAAMATVVFQDSGYHVIDYPISESVDVRNGFFGDPTTIEIVGNGHVYDGIVSAYGSSRIIVNGGALGTGSNPSGCHVRAWENSEIAISAGTILAEISSFESSSLAISGGTMKDSLFIHDESQAQISGGSIEGNLSCRGSSQTTISGGSVAGAIPITGDASLTVEGHSFSIDYQQAPYGTYDRGGEITRYGLLTAGVLASGELASHEFSLSDSGTITLVPSPVLGDADLDDHVDGLDYVIWSNNYHLSGMTWEQGDFTGEGYVDGLDYIIWSNNYDVGSPGTPGQVPEPASAVVLLAASVALARRRTRPA